jgi:NADH:ubiquinone oxidoreductase subunit 5 (subunit L)/multisubunit Na+/H+ antiporter MnhA subunit
VGDSAFLASISFLFYLFKSLNFGVIFSMIPFFYDQTFQFLCFSISYIEIIAFFFFLAAVGKSAQLGLHG